MDSAGDSVDVQCPLEVFSSSKDRKIIALKSKVIGMIISAICALLNSNGGKVVLQTDLKHLSSSQKSSLIRIIEQTMVSTIGTHQTVSNISFENDEEKFDILVKKVDSLITTTYNICLPSETQIMQVPATEPLKNVIDIINRKVLWQLIVPGSHQKTFLKNKNCGFPERKMVQFKCLKSEASKRTTQGDRITGKGNKFSCYVSGFANHGGGHIYYGVNDHGVVEGQFVPSEDDKNEITKKIEKAINKMIWPEQIGQPKRGEHWEIFFEQVVDEYSKKPIPSTFVIVIFVAPCLGGVFTEEPECYEMVEGKVAKMSFSTWKKRILQPVWLPNKEEIPISVRHISWSSAESREACSDVHQVLMPLINNGKWKEISKKSRSLVNKYPQVHQIKLLILSKRITARYRRGHCNKAQALLHEFMEILPQAKDQSIFEVLQLYLNAALKRACGDLVGLKEFLFAALSKAELIEPGLVPAIVYGFAATVADLVKSEDQTDMISPQHLSIKSLQCLKSVSGPPKALAIMKQKSHITLATFYLGFNISGQRINRNEVRLAEAKKSIMAIHEIIYEGNSLSDYSKVQLRLVQSIYCYRYSQEAPPDQRALNLAEAFNYAKEAECLATNCQFTELAEWSATHKALCTEELIRTRLLSGVALSHPRSEL